MTARKRSSGKSAGRKSSKTPVKTILLIVLIILIIIVAGLIYWFLPNIVNWFSRIWKNLTDVLGIGIGIIAIYIIVTVVMFVGADSSVFIKRCRYWLGGIAFALAAWGIIAFIDPELGGASGSSIITASATTGVLRLIALLFAGSLLMAPRQTWRAVVSFFKALWKSVLFLASSISAATAKPRKEIKSITKPVAEIQYEKPSPFQPEPVRETPVTPAVTPAPAETTTPEAWEPGKYQPSLTVGGWQLPPVSIMDKAVETEVSQADVEKRSDVIADALASYGVDAKVVQINIGPTVTQFGVEPGWDKKYKEVKERDKDGNIKTKQVEVSRTRVKVERISSLANDLALALAAPSIRIEAPVPGKSIVGIEVPNTTFGSVNLRSIIESPSFQKMAAKSKLTIALGKGAGGETVAADLAKMPHLLVAGATGSGKTVYLNSIICCLLLFNTPDDLRFIMIDPKRVELVNFNMLPHLIAPVVVETDKAVGALRWLTEEMDERYRKFAQAGARNIEAYNKGRHPGDAIPYIVLIIDELADLMMISFDEVEHNLCRLAQLSRATGIHLIVATQRPSVDVVTGLIKANFPTRISFTLTSQVDSRTILDTAGAEKLLGRGDMLYMPTDASKPKRLQGPFLTDAEIDRLTNFWNNQRKPDAVPVQFEDVSQSHQTSVDSDDSLLEEAKKLTEEHEHMSVSFLQRRLRIGYPRAARLFDKLKEEGYIDQSKAQGQL